MASPMRDGLDSFKRHRLAFGESLVCPVWPMYQAYSRHCEELGFARCNGHVFLGFLAQEGIVVRQRDKGSLRAVALGCGVTASEAREAMQAAVSRGENPPRFVKANPVR